MPAQNKKKKTRKANKRKNNKSLWLLLVLLLLLAGIVLFHTHEHKQQAKKDIDSFRAQPFNVVRPLAKPVASPSGLSPSAAKKAYDLGKVAGKGTIAIINAFDDPNIKSDLATFSKHYHLKSCTTKNKCFEIHKMRPKIRSSTDWAVEISLDVEWAHAISPSAKILLVEASSNSGTDLLQAIDYARNRSDVVAVSMSWGGSEFSTEASFEDHFVSPTGATFFAASGDSGHGVSWPAVSANVIGVGGTTVKLNRHSNISSEIAWSGSGGGVSKYISEPLYQQTFNVPSTGGKRAVPDVSYNANPSTGFPVYDSLGCSSKKRKRSLCWYKVGGTSVGAPQWAAIRTIAGNLTADQLYADAAVSNQHFLRDIVAGANGKCGYFCATAAGYDYVTGLGSPLGKSF